MKAESLFIMLCLLMSQYVGSGQSPSMHCVAGKATNQITGGVISQLTVVEMKSGIGTITADDGSFSLLLRPGNVELHFFSEEYLSQSVTFSLTRDTTLQVNLSALESKQGKKVRKAKLKNASQSAFMTYPKPSKHEE